MPLQAHITDPSLPVARLGRSQALLARKRHLDAVTELEATLEPTSGWIDGLQVRVRCRSSLCILTLHEGLAPWQSRASACCPWVQLATAGSQCTVRPPPWHSNGCSVQWR